MSVVAATNVGATNVTHNRATLNWINNDASAAYLDLYIVGGSDVVVGVNITEPGMPYSRRYRLPPTQTTFNATGLQNSLQWFTYWIVTGAAGTENDPPMNTWNPSQRTSALKRFMLFPITLNDDYDSLILEFADITQTRFDVAENRVYRVLIDVLNGQPTTIPNFGTFQFVNFPDLTDEDANYTMTAHREIALQPHPTLQQIINGAPNTIPTDTDRNIVAHIWAKYMQNNNSCIIPGFGIIAAHSVPSYIDGTTVPAHKRAAFYRESLRYRYPVEFVNGQEFNGYCVPTFAYTINNVPQYNFSVIGAGAWPHLYQAFIRVPPIIESENDCSEAVAEATASLQTQLSAAQTQNTNLEVQFNGLSNEFALLQQHSINLQAQIQSLQAQLQAANNQITQLQNTSTTQTVTISLKTPDDIPITATLNLSGVGQRTTDTNGQAVFSEVPYTTNRILTIFAQTGYVPQRREGAYRIRDFTKLNAYERVGGIFYNRDLDFINVQALSMAQAAEKCRAIANSPDSNMTLFYRLRWRRQEEWSALRQFPGLNDAFNEIARVIEFAVEEIRNQQRFNFVSEQFARMV